MFDTSFEDKHTVVSKKQLMHEGTRPNSNRETVYWDEGRQQHDRVPLHSLKKVRCQPSMAVVAEAIVLHIAHGFVLSWMANFQRGSTYAYPSCPNGDT